MLQQAYYALTSRTCRLRLKRWSLLVFLLAFLSAFLFLAWKIEADNLAATAAVAGVADTAAASTAAAAAAVEPQGPVNAAGGKPEDDQGQAAHKALQGLRQQHEPPRPQAPPQPSSSAPGAAKPGSKPGPVAIHPEYKRLIKEYPFQPVRNERGQLVNIILVRAPFEGEHHAGMYNKYKDEILFLGLSSFEVFPLSSPNPFSGTWPRDKYLGLFPGFLHMMRDPSIFPSHVKLLLMSQSDFSLPRDSPSLTKKFDFTFAGSDQDVANDCVGWASFAKNWSFVKEALEMMCGEYNMKGVLVATKDKQDQKACSIPKVCEGKIIQTKFLDQGQFFSYAKQSKFVFLPQVYDASPRVSTQALALDVPVLMNWNIAGGWKYVNEKTGEFFHDMSDFRESLDRIMQSIAAGKYEPRKYIFQHYDDQNSGTRLKQFVEENFADRVTLPLGTRWLLPSGA